MKIEKVEEPVPNIHDKTEYVIHIRNLKQALNHGLELKTVHRIIKFNQKAWLKPYIDMNTDLRIKVKKIILKNTFLSYIGVCLIKRKKYELFGIRTKLSYNNLFTENLLAIDYMKPKCVEKAKLYYMDTDSFIVYIKTNDVYKNIAESVGTSNYELKVPKFKNKKIIGLMKDALRGKIMKKFLELKAKTYIYSIDDGSEIKKAKGTKKCVIKNKLKFEHYKNCLEATQPPSPAPPAPPPPKKKSKIK